MYAKGSLRHYLADLLRQQAALDILQQKHDTPRAFTMPGIFQLLRTRSLVVTEMQWEREPNEASPETDGSYAQECATLAAALEEGCIEQAGYCSFTQLMCMCGEKAGGKGGGEKKTLSANSCSALQSHLPSEEMDFLKNPCSLPPLVKGSEDQFTDISWFPIAILVRT